MLQRNKKTKPTDCKIPYVTLNKTQLSISVYIYMFDGNWVRVEEKWKKNAH